MTALDEPLHNYLELPGLLRRAAGHVPSEPRRDAVLRYAAEPQEKGDAELVSHAALRDALQACEVEYEGADDL